MIEYKWKKLNEVVYWGIYKEYRDELFVFSSCTAPLGDPSLGISKPYILTEWGFKDAQCPLIKCISTKKDFEQREYDHETFIAIPTGCDCEEIPVIPW